MIFNYDLKPKKRYELLKQIYDLAIKQDSLYFIRLDSEFYSHGGVFDIQYLEEKGFIGVDAENEGVPVVITLDSKGVDLIESMTFPEQ